MKQRLAKLLFVICSIGFTSVAHAQGWLEKKFKQTVEGTIETIDKATPLSLQHAQKAVTKAIDDVAQAGGAAAKFMDQQRRGSLETVDKAFHQKNVGKSLEFALTHPVRQTNQNAQQALKSSPVLAAAASVAASAYGGPAGAAAFAAWTTYNATGSIEAALRVGATKGIIASATASVNAMPVGADKVAAQTALSAAVAKAEGGNSEAVRQAALGSLVSMAGGKVKDAGLNAAQRTMASAAIGGAAVAASGGNRDAIRSGFLQAGGKVLAQDLSAAKDEAVNKAKEEATTRVGAVLSAEQIAAANDAYRNAKNILTDSDVNKLIESAKKKYDETKSVVKVDVAQRTANLTRARTIVDVQRGAIKKEQDNLKNVTLAIQSDTKQRLDQIGAEAKSTGNQIRTEEKKALQEAKRKSDQIVAAARADIKRASDIVRGDVVSAISDEFEKNKKTPLLILDDGTIVSWNSRELLSTNNINTSVVLSVPASAAALLDFFFSARKPGLPR